MRVFPADFLADRITIGLNMAWKLAPVRYGLTIGPHLNVPEFMAEERPHPEITWITKRAKAAAVLRPEQFTYANDHFFQYEIGGGVTKHHDLEEPHEEGRNLDHVRRPTGIKLYQWSSISQTAVNLAANMGARNIILVGCDNCSLSGNHHGHQQHTKWLGAAPEHRYQQYHEGLLEVRSALKERGVNLVSLSPFLRLGDPTAEFNALCQELGQPQHLSGPDISEVDHPRRFLESPTPRGRRSGGEGRIRGGLDLLRASTRRLTRQG
jgi:hypothetical protein